MAVYMDCGINLNYQNIAGNTSNVTAWINVRTTYGSYNHNGDTLGSVTFGGNASGTYSLNGATFDLQSTTRIYTRQFNVTHNADGTGSVNFSAWFNTQVSSGTIYGNASLNLPTIPRASTPTVSGAAQLGSAMTINTNRASSSFTHNLKYRYGNGAYTGTIATGVGASYTYTPPLDFANNVTDATSFNFAIICETYSGQTLIGTKETIITMQIPASIGPSISSVTPSDTTTLHGIFGAYVQNQSNIKVAVSASSQYGATIASITASLDGLSASGSSPLTLGAPPQSGSRSIAVTVKDSRGRTASASTPITVAAYSAPVLSARAYRYDTAQQEESDESTTIRVEIYGSVTNVNNAGENSALVAIGYRVKGVPDFTPVNSANRGQSYDFTFDIPNCPETSVYEIQVKVTDTVGQSATIELEVGTARPVMDWRGDGTGVAFYGIADRDGVRVNHRLSIGNDYGIDLESDAGASVPFVEVQSTGRPTLMNHVGLANTMWLQGQLASGTFTNILRMNADGQVELNWSSGGIRGRVMKTIWSGTLSKGASIGTSDLPYYRIFLIYTNASGEAIIAWKCDPDSTAGNIMGASHMTGADNQQWLNALHATYNGTNFKFDRVVSTFVSGSSIGSYNTNSTLTKIIGVI